MGVKTRENSPRPNTPEAIALRARISTLAKTFDPQKLSSRRKKRRYKNFKMRLFSDREVLAIRQDMWNNQSLSLRLYAEAYGVAVNTIHRIANGDTYEHLNAIVPVITKKFERPGYLERQAERKRRVIPVLAELRNHNPIWWTYGRLAKYFTRVVGRPYGADYTRHTILEENPDLWDIDTGPEGQHTFPTRSKYQLSCVQCNTTFESTFKPSKYCSPMCRTRGARKRQTIRRRDQKREYYESRGLSL